MHNNYSPHDRLQEQQVQLSLSVIRQVTVISDSDKTSDSDK
jgi:hypothetical protein